MMISQMINKKTEAFLKFNLKHHLVEFKDPLSKMKSLTILKISISHLLLYLRLRKNRSLWESARSWNKSVKSHPKSRIFSQEEQRLLIKPKKSLRKSMMLPYPKMKKNSTSMMMLSMTTSLPTLI